MKTATLEVMSPSSATEVTNDDLATALADPNALLAHLSRANPEDRCHVGSPWDCPIANYLAHYVGREISCGYDNVGLIDSRHLVNVKTPGWAQRTQDAWFEREEERLNSNTPSYLTNGEAADILRNLIEMGFVAE